MKPSHKRTRQLSIDNHDLNRYTNYINKHNHSDNDIEITSESIIYHHRYHRKQQHDNLLSSSSSAATTTSRSILNILNDNKENDDGDNDDKEEEGGEEEEDNENNELKQGWYYVDKKGETQGPISIRKLKILYNRKELKSHHYLWNGTSVDSWTQLKDIQILNDQINNIDIDIDIDIDEDKIFNYKGYKLDIFNNNNNNLQQYICGICNNICRNCIESSCSYGHLYCNYCIKNVDNNKCTLCNDNDNNDNLKYHPIQYIRRKINKLNCKCINYNIGCSWNGKLCDLLNHLKFECKYIDILCIECNNYFKRKYYSKHILICNQYMIKCTKCGKKIKHKNFKYHLSNECTERITKCLYAKIGCNHKMKYCELNQHLNEFIVKHNQLQFLYFDIINNCSKYIYVSGIYNNSLIINGLYQRINTIDTNNDMNNDLNNDINNLMIKPIYKKRNNTNTNSTIYIRYNFKNNRWIFETKNKKILLSSKNTTNERNPYNVLFEPSINLNGFTDLYLFRELNLFKSCEFIEIYGRNGINIDINGIYKKQNNLHDGKVWYKKLKGKYKWVIRYYSQSQLWLFDKRGLRNDDIANGIGKGDVLSPLYINQWEIHNGKTFIIDNNIKLRKYTTI